jgi:hypothetical protein
MQTHCKTDQGDFSTITKKCVCRSGNSGHFCENGAEYTHFIETAKSAFSRFYKISKNATEPKTSAFFDNYVLMKSLSEIPGFFTGPETEIILENIFAKTKNEIFNISKEFVGSLETISKLLISYSTSPEKLKVKYAAQQKKLLHKMIEL